METQQLLLQLLQASSQSSEDASGNCSLPIFRHSPDLVDLKRGTFVAHSHGTKHHLPQHRHI